jgi:D-glycero-D-manno-heptose 1,7-bisphosphate phosphatase
MEMELAREAAHVDEFRYCPFHPDGTVAEYRRDAECRKPKPGMIMDLMRAWRIDPARSLLIGDKESDCVAAATAGIRAYMFRGGDLSSELRHAMDDQVGALAFLKDRERHALANPLHSTTAPQEVEVGPAPSGC